MNHAANNTDPLRIVVIGYIVRGPLGGLVWHHLQYVMGLARMGHDVCFIEDSDDYPSCYDPERNLTDKDPSYGLKFTAKTFEKVGLADSWTYHDAHTSRWLGPRSHDALRFCRDADLLINLSGMNPMRPWLRDIPVRALVDTDPVFMQIRHIKDDWSRGRAQAHTAFFSFGENIGQPGCTIPDDGFTWQATRQPVVLEAWPVTPGPPEGCFTTVMQWKSYDAQEYGGQRYGMKADSFGPYEGLPERVEVPLELAATGVPQGQLREKGWRLRDAVTLTRDPDSYQQYIRESKCEFSIAKQGYVISRSGWFSERSSAYLASGRPVLAQDTGFGTWLPAGEGLIAFDSPETAIAGIHDINSRYAAHCKAARELVAEYFDATRVLADLIERSMSS